MKEAGSVDPIAVRDAILNADEIPTLYGPASCKWYGEELYGTMNYVMPFQWPMMLYEGGYDRIQGWQDMPEWWEWNKDAIIDALTEAGFLE